MTGLRIITRWTLTLSHSPSGIFEITATFSFASDTNFLRFLCGKHEAADAFRWNNSQKDPVLRLLSQPVTLGHQRKTKSASAARSLTLDEVDNFDRRSIYYSVCSVMPPSDLEVHHARDLQSNASKQTFMYIPTLLSNGLQTGRKFILMYYGFYPKKPIKFGARDLARSTHQLCYFARLHLRWASEGHYPLVSRPFVAKFYTAMYEMVYSY